jgi:hypothetical protein
LFLLPQLFQILIGTHCDRPTLPQQTDTAHSAHATAERPTLTQRDRPVKEV